MATSVFAEPPSALPHQASFEGQLRSKKPPPFANAHRDGHETHLGGHIVKLGGSLNFEADDDEVDSRSGLAMRGNK